MKLAIATVCLSGGLGEKLEAIAAAGFREVEIFENDLLGFDGTPAQIRTIAADLGLRIAVYQPFRDFEGLPAPLREKAFARAERKFDLLGELGCDLLMVCSNISPHSLGGIDRAAADFRELGERAEKRGIKVGFEALAWGRHVYDYRDAWEIVRRADHPSVGLVLDSFHVLARGTDLAAMRSVPGDRIALVQMADAPRLDMDYLNWGRHFRSFPGQGELPTEPFMDALAATGFDGLLSLEIFSDRFRGGSAKTVAVDGHRSLLNALDGVERRAGHAGFLPPPAHVAGTAFVEFAVSEASAQQLTSVLGALGFVKVARHRSKAIDRWSQGGIDIVLNYETGDFAHSFYLVHGASVCALALEVDHAAAAASRALALLDQPFQQPVGAGELEIPAVRGIGGSLLYFVDHESDLARHWEIDFVPVEGVVLPVAGTGLTRIDHIAQTMPHEDLLTWGLFYTALFDLVKSPAQELLDPGGIVQSQALETRDGSLRLVLNASQSRRTLSSRFLSDAFGAGVQHIAFETDDVLATVARLAASGVKLLPIPGNYYDDLEARTDLGVDEIARLRAANILHDSDAGGEFRHAFTQSLLEDGYFFFEIVERRGYAGYGAANAPIRLAAQTRLAPAPGMPRMGAGAEPGGDFSS